MENIDDYTKEKMKIPGTIEWKILNIPIYSRVSFLQKFPGCSFISSFWKEQWKIRDEMAKKYVGEERSNFLKENCFESDIIVWSSMYSVIDRWKNEGRNEDGTFDVSIK
jgi:hypothetical protein